MLLANDFCSTNLAPGLHEGDCWGSRLRLAMGYTRTPDKCGILMTCHLQHAGLLPAEIHAKAMAFVCLLVKM